jgi:hypothetical protein
MGSAKRKPPGLGVRKLALYEHAYRLALASLRGYRWAADDQLRTEEIKTALSESIVEKITEDAIEKSASSAAVAQIARGTRVFTGTLPILIMAFPSKCPAPRSKKFWSHGLFLAGCLDASVRGQLLHTGDREGSS